MARTRVRPAPTSPAGGSARATRARVCARPGRALLHRLQPHARPVFPGGCQCANGDCGSRRIDCNHFRYGQCNTQVVGTTEVVCRLMICQSPSTVGWMNCNDTVMVDDNTCYHDAGCLQGLAVRYPNAGGADGRPGRRRDGAVGDPARARGRAAAQPRRAAAPDRSRRRGPGAGRRARQRRPGSSVAEPRAGAAPRRPAPALPASHPGGDAVALDFAGRGDARSCSRF